jgi:hypothetical protein
MAITGICDDMREVILPYGEATLRNLV